MIPKRCHRGITILEVLVVILILGILVGILFPATEVAREASRKTACKSNLSQIGRAIHLYDEQKGVLPKSHYTPASETEASIDLNSRGWSWAVEITPFMERGDIRDLIDMSNPADNPDQDTDDVKAVAAATIPIFSCPSFSGSQWVEHQASGPRPKSVDKDSSNRCLPSNYKALAASKMDSLAVAYGGPKPDYGTDHPDGAINPLTDYPIDAISDGTSHTFLLAESAERACSRWIYGNEMEMIGLPDTIEMVEVPDYHYPVPAGFNPQYPQWYEESEIDPGVNGSGQPFAAWIYSGSEKAPSYDGQQANNPDAWLGPSSDHPAAVNHLFADGSSKSISKTVDAAAYYFMITRCNGDPGFSRR